MEISIAKTMIIKAFDNDMVDGRVLKAFRNVKCKLKKGSNARKRTLSFDEYVRLIDKSPQHLKACIIIAYNTGMRTGELRLLKCLYVDRIVKLIKLPAKVTKEGRSKNIPINHHVQKALDSLPNGIIFHDIRRTVKTNMLAAGIDKVHRDLILGHSLKGMDVHYMAPDDDTLRDVVDKYTHWLDDQFQNVDQNENKLEANSG